MKNRNTEKSQTKSLKISKLDFTEEKLSSRSGLFFIMEYLENLGLLTRFVEKFHYLKKSNKGLCIKDYFKQLFGFFFDGTNLNLTYFDELKNDESYCELLKTKPSDMASSHSIKRITNKFQGTKREVGIFRDVLTDIFIQNLLLEKPEVVELGIDTMVLNNDDSKLKEGCNPTYKGVKGFQPLQVYWNGMLIDAIFREGKCHSNHSNDVQTTMKRLVKKIRKALGSEIPIIVKMDSGFLSNSNLTYFEKELKIHYICVGKMMSSIKDYIGELRSNNKKVYSGNHNWEFVEFGNRLKSWDTFRRAVYVQQEADDKGQLILDFARSDRIIYTNIGITAEADTKLHIIGKKEYFTPEYIIEAHHSRAIDELTNREFKDFMTKEKLPFKSFNSNQAFYFIMAISFSIIRNFQRKISSDILYSNSRVSTFRRLFIDIPGKIVSHAGNKILKVVKSYYDKYKLMDIWLRCNNVSHILSYF